MATPSTLRVKVSYYCGATDDAADKESTTVVQYWIYENSAWTQVDPKQIQEEPCKEAEEVVVEKVSWPKPINDLPRKSHSQRFCSRILKQPFRERSTVARNRKGRVL